MYRIAIAVLVIAVAGTLAFGQKANVIGSEHDINSAGCKSCHAPHNGSVATGGADQNTGKLLLWDRAFTSQTFKTYESPTLDNPAAEVGTAPPAMTDARLYSFLCLSCHDGVTSASLIGPTDKHAIGHPTNSAGLQNDHPVNLSHDPTKDAGLQTVANVKNAGLIFFGAANTVQCSSCHNAHDKTITPFLRKSNTNSALCLTCHL